jgi:hopanoid biosynthesis associated protein HpnK
MSRERRRPIMAPLEPPRRLIVNADDFGLSVPINEAVVQAHREGILTSASLMVNEAEAGAARALARANPKLGVGLHLSLVHGRTGLPAAQIPGLAEAGGRFREGGVRAGFSYFFNRRLQAELEAEIAFQFEAFHATGLPLDHVNGHLNMHLHPVILRLLLQRAGEWGVRRIRLTRDPFFLNARLAGGAWGYRLSHAVIYRCLSAWAEPRLRRRGIAHTSSVFGLLQNGRVNEEFVLGLLPRLPPGDSELYSHPSGTQFKEELAALTSPRARELVRRLGIQLIRYQDLRFYGQTHRNSVDRPDF